MMRKVRAFSLPYVCAVLLLLAHGVHAQQSAAKPAFTFQEVMIPMRDGVRLQTVILAPSDQKAPLPILFRRTPYGVPSRALQQAPPNYKELEQDGYIYVIQNLRGRFKSEGVFKRSFSRPAIKRRHCRSCFNGLPMAFQVVRFHKCL